MNIWFCNVNTNSCKLEGSFITQRKKWYAYHWVYTCPAPQPQSPLLNCVLLKNHWLLICRWPCSNSYESPLLNGHKYGCFTVRRHCRTHLVFARCHPGLHLATPSTRPDVRDGTAPPHADCHPQASCPLEYPLITWDFFTWKHNTTKVYISYLVGFVPK